MDTNTRPNVLRFGATLLLTIAPSSAVFGQSEVHPLLSSQFTVDAGVFFPQSDFEFEVAGSFDTGLAKPIDFEKVYDSSIDDKIASIDFTWRFSNDWSLWGQYMKFDDRVASAVLDEDVQWGDVTFGAGTGIAAGLENSITRVFFGKTLVNSVQSELGVGFGAHIIQVNTFIEGAAIINGNPVGSRRETARTSGALPNLGGVVHPRIVAEIGDQNAHRLVGGGYRQVQWPYFEPVVRRELPDV